MTDAAQTHQCTCPLPQNGVYPINCSKFHRQQSKEEHQICRGELYPEKRAYYLNLWTTKVQNLAKPVLGLGHLSLRLLIKKPRVFWSRWKQVKIFGAHDVHIPKEPWFFSRFFKRVSHRRKVAEQAVRSAVVRRNAQGPYKTTITVGLAVFDDFERLKMTIQHIRLTNSEEALKNTSFVIVDNNPTSTPMGTLNGRKALTNSECTMAFVHRALPSGRWIPLAQPVGTGPAKNRIFEESITDVTLVIDCHVLLEPGAIDRLLKFYDENPECNDLLQGPMYDDNIPNIHATHLDPVWRGNMYGTWGNDPELRVLDAPPKEIPLAGMGLFACRTKAWPGFHPKFQGFGGEEYMGDKFRSLGRKVVCMPWLRWWHAFGRAGSTPRNVGTEPLRNYLLAFEEIDAPLAPVIDHFRTILPEPEVTKLVNSVRGASKTVASGHKVSCLMSTYGRWTNVCRSLSCFLQQDYEDAELIILNNHPEPLIFDHPKVKIINEPGHPTLGACRNRVLKEATGDYCTTWDDDDLYLPHTLSQRMAFVGDAGAWKPERSWTSEGDKVFKLSGNWMEASYVWRTDLVREFGFDNLAANEHIRMLEKIKHLTRTNEMGVWASYCYMWGHGNFHISGSLGSGSVEHRTAEWMKQNKDVKPGKPLVPIDLTPYWRRMSEFVDDHLRTEWLKRMTKDTPPRSDTTVPKMTQLQRIFDVVFPNRKNFTVCEFGRLRSADPKFLEGDGGSTRQLAVDPRVRRIYSIDPDTSTEKVCRQIIPSDVLPKIMFLNQILSLDQFDAPIDFLYLDTSDDPWLNFHCLKSVMAKLSDIAVIAVDDYKFNKKHVLIRAFLESSHQAFVIGDALVFERRKRPVQENRPW